MIFPQLIILLMIIISYLSKKGKIFLREMIDFLSSTELIQAAFFLKHVKKVQNVWEGYDVFQAENVGSY